MDTFEYLPEGSGKGLSSSSVKGRINMQIIQPIGGRALTAAACVLCVATTLFAGQTAAPQAAQPQQPQAQQPQQISVTPAEAFRLITAEAEKGNAAAMLRLGTFYEQGVGTARNFVKALEWYKKAAAAGSAEAYYRVGIAYEVGLGNTGSMTEAFNNIEKSAELNLPAGFYKLASMYIAGNGVQKNESWGVTLLNRAVSLGHMGAANDLGVVYFEGLFGQKKDDAKAFEMFSRAAELGNAEAMKNLGIFYRDGIGGRPADPAQELKWYTLAFRLGFRADPLVAAAKQLQDKLGPDKVKQIDAEADKWVADFQARLAAQQQAAAAPAAKQ